jgi:predicted GIY-YIG superfamily endonuclease
MIRMLIPKGFIGTYVLYHQDRAHYVGRSDTCLRRRLLQHCRTSRAEYFTYDVHPSPEQAFAMECALFHDLRKQLLNILHPARPNFSRTPCPFCKTSLETTRQRRIPLPTLKKTPTRKGTR